MVSQLPFSCVAFFLAAPSVCSWSPQLPVPGGKSMGNNSGDGRWARYSPHSPRLQAKCFQPPFPSGRVPWREPFGRKEGPQTRYERHQSVASLQCCRPNSGLPGSWHENAPCMRTYVGDWRRHHRVSRWPRHWLLVSASPRSHRPTGTRPACWSI